MVQVESKPQVTAALGAEFTGNTNGGPNGRWASLRLWVDGWSGVLPEGDPWAEIRPHFWNKEAVVLARLDCEAGTFFRVLATDYRGYRNDRVTLGSVDVPLLRTGPVGFRCRVYLGTAGMPVLDQRLQFVVPAARLRDGRTAEDVASSDKSAALASQRAAEARQKYYNASGLGGQNPSEFDRRYDYWLTWFDQVSRAQWNGPRGPWEEIWETDHWLQRVQTLEGLYQALNGVYYYRRQNESVWRKTAPSNWGTLNEKALLLLQHGQLDLADQWLAVIERDAGRPPGPLYGNEKPYGEDLGYVYSNLIRAYGEFRLNPDKMLELHRRLKAWVGGEVADQAFHSSHQAIHQRVRAARAFFDPEAFQ
jgi:hypothetical protein